MILLKSDDNKSDLTIYQLLFTTLNAATYTPTSYMYYKHIHSIIEKFRISNGMSTQLNNDFYLPNSHFN